jgi:hypothetical protein
VTAVNDIFFKKYKSIKDNFNVVYKGYQLNGIMAKDFIFCAYKMQDYKFTTSFIKSKLFYAQDLQDFKDLLIQENVMFSFDNYGMDHLDLLQTIRDQLDDSVLFQPKNQYKRHINFGNIIISFLQILIFSKIKNINYKHRFYFFLVLVQYKNTISLLEKYSSKVNITKFIPYLSCFPLDSIICQFFKKRNIKTYGIQHALYCSFLDYRTYIPYDVINIENLQSDYILGWGNFTKEVLIKWGKSESQFLLAGNPKYLDINKVVIKASAFKKCILCLARDLYFDGNVRLLKIAKELERIGIEVHLKFHPRSDLKKYEVYLKSNNCSIFSPDTSIRSSIEIVNPDFVIVYNSTVYYENYINGLITFRYAFNSNDIPFGLNDEFVNFNELKVKINEFKNKNKIELTEEINKMVNRFCALGINNYREILVNKKDD